VWNPPLLLRSKLAVVSLSLYARSVNP